MKGRGQNILLVTDIGSVLYKKAFYKAQSCTRLCRSHNSNGAGNQHGRRLGQPNFDEVKGGFPPTSGIKKYHIKRKQEGDPVKGRGQNIPLVTDTGSGLCRQA